MKTPEEILKKNIKTFIYKCLRFALTGSENGMDVVDIMIFLGRDKTMQRIQNCVMLEERKI